MSLETLTFEKLLHILENSPENLDFNQTMGVIDSLYTFTPTSFTNGQLRNDAGQNSGSCKLFAFAKLQQFSEQQTLDCFGQYYREDVLKNPESENHQNIRNFMSHGWNGISFESEALQAR